MKLGLRSTDGHRSGVVAMGVVALVLLLALTSTAGARGAGAVASEPPNDPVSNSRVLRSTLFSNPPGGTAHSESYSGMVGTSDVWATGSQCAPTDPSSCLTSNSASLRVGAPPSLQDPLGSTATSGAPLVPPDAGTAYWPIGVVGLPSDQNRPAKGLVFSNMVSKTSYADLGTEVSVVDVGATTSARKGLLFDANDCEWRSPFSSRDGNYEYFISTPANRRSRCPNWSAGTGDENEVLFARVATDDLSAFVDDVTSSQPSADALTTLKNAFQYLTNDQDANGDPKWSATESEAATSWRPTFGRWASHGWMSIVWNGSMGTDGEYVAVIGVCGGIVSLAEAWASLVEWTDLNCGTKVQYSTIEQIDDSSAARGHCQHHHLDHSGRPLRHQRRSRCRLEGQQLRRLLIRTTP